MKKYISVLLAVFIFVLGMTITKDVFAAPDTSKLANDIGSMVAKQVGEGLLFDVSEPVNSLEDQLKIEGVKNLKLIEKGDNSLVTGELAAGQKIRIHCYQKKYPLSQVNEKRRVNGENPIEYYNWNCTIFLTAKNIKNQVIKEIKKSYKNTRDNILEYQAAKDVTRIEIKISGSYVGQVKGHEKPSTGKVNSDPIILTVNGKLKPVPIASAKDSKDKNAPAKKADGKQTAKKADEESGGLGTVGTVGIGLAAAGAIGFGVTHLGGGAGAGGGSGAAGAAEAETPPAPPEPESFVFTDPATGAQSLYEKDPETGQWVNPQTGGIVDISDLDRFAKQRQADADWTRGQAEKLSNRDTDLDRAWREQDAKTDAELQRKFEEIDRQGARDRVAIKSGTYGMSEEERTKYLTERQERLQKNSEAANQSAKNWDRITKTAEVVEKAADIAVDGLSVATGPAGQLVANVYSGAKNIAGSTSEAIAKGESIVGGITKGVAKGGADIAQNLAGGKWVKKLATYAGSETLKEVVVAAVDGENVLKAAGKGLVNGTFKYAVSEIGDNISAGYGKQNENLMKQHYKEIKNVWSKSKDLSQKSVNALQSMNFQKYFGKETTRELAQGFGQSITKEIGATTYDMGVEGKSVTESLFDDKW